MKPNWEDYEMAGGVHSAEPGKKRTAESIWGAGVGTALVRGSPSLLLSEKSGFGGSCLPGGYSLAPSQWLTCSGTLCDRMSLSRMTDVLG